MKYQFTTDELILKHQLIRIKLKKDEIKEVFIPETYEFSPAMLIGPIDHINDIVMLRTTKGDFYFHYMGDAVSFVRKVQDFCAS